MIDIASEIKRVTDAIEKTQSPYLKRDYEKYLKKLYKKQKEQSYGARKAKN